MDEKVQEIIEETGLDDAGKACLKQISKTTFAAFQEAGNENRDTVKIDFPEALKNLDREAQHRVRFAWENLLELLRRSLP